MADPGIITKIVFFFIASILILNSVQTAPTDLQKENVKNCSDSDNNQEEYDLIDQRQNGSQNLRINVKDVVVIWAPFNSLLAATALLDADILGADYLYLDENGEKPQNGQSGEKPQNGQSGEKPQNGQSGEKPEIIVELLENNKPVEQNSTVSSTELPEKEMTSVATTEKAADEKGSKHRNVGPILRRRFHKH